MFERKITLFGQIANDAELDLLKQLGIELVDNTKLVNVKTGEELVPQEWDPEKWYNFVYKSSDIVVTFEAMVNPYKPVRLNVEKDGLKYVAGEQKEFERWSEGRYLSIARIGEKKDSVEKENQILIEPQVERRFIRTYLGSWLVSSKTIYGDFKSVIVRDNYADEEMRYGDLDVETYESALVEYINTTFPDEKIRNAYLQCVPYFINEFKKLLSFPARAETLFSSEYHESLANFDHDMMEYQISYLAKDRERAIEEAGSNEEDISEHKKTAAKAKSYVDSAIDMYSRIREIMERREKLKAKWKSLLAEVEEYRNNYYNIAKGTKK